MLSEYSTDLLSILTCSWITMLNYHLRVTQELFCLLLSYNPVVVFEYDHYFAAILH